MKALSEVVDIAFITDARRIELGEKDIERRVLDWKNRINELYNSVKLWLKEKDGYSVSVKVDQIMHEGLMKTYNTAPERLPSADIFHDNKLVMSIKPFGLWIIGANGRLDIITSHGNHTLVDLSSNFRSTDWHIFRISDTQNGKKFNKTNFFSLLSK